MLVFTLALLLLLLMASSFSMANTAVVALVIVGIYLSIYSYLGRRVSSFESVEFDESGIRLVNLLGKSVFVPLENLSFRKACLASSDNGESRALIVLECSRIQSIKVGLSEYDGNWTHFSRYYSKSDLEMNNKQEWNKFMTVLEKYCHEI